MIDLIVGIWVSAILLGHTIGPALMIWLTFTLEYYEAAMVFFAFGLLVAGIY